MLQRIEQITKAKLIQALRVARAELDYLVVQLTPVQLLHPVEGEWTVKDVLAHVAAWEQRMVIWVECACTGMSPAVAPSQIDFDQVNAQTYRVNQARPVPAILAEYQQSFPVVLNAIDAVPAALIADSSPIAWLAGRPLWKVIAANTWWHYAEHGQRIAQLLR